MGWKRQARYLLERSQRLLYGAATRVSRHPEFRLQYDYLRFKHDGNLAEISARYGIDVGLLERQRDAGIDNPAYRFYRDGGFFSYFAANAAIFKGSSWLDVGADTGAVSLYLSELLASKSFELCDVTVAPRALFPVRRITGERLDYEPNSFDIVFFSYVLHHAADDTIQLLRDARKVARKYVVVTEDPKENADDYYWAYMHDKRGTFRGCKEWRQLFDVVGLSIVHDEALNPELHSRHMFVLDANK